MMSERSTVRCGSCELVQYEAPVCRRCKRVLPKPLEVIVVKTIVVKREAEATPVAEQNAASTVSKLAGDCIVFGDKLPTCEELESALIREALKRCGGSKLAAAEMLGLGKTTVYRKAAELERVEDFNLASEPSRRKV